MLEFTKESIDKAIENIDQFPELQKGRESKDYDLLLDNGKTYPPILVLSEAHKILGGEALVVSDFYNSTRKPFNILKKLGYNVVSRNLTNNNSHIAKNSEALNYRAFLDFCELSNLYVSEQLAIRFIASLITKPFVILTGLSGSGKTKLALAFSKWITHEHVQTNLNYFSIGDYVKSNRVTYLVTAADKISVTFTQNETGTKATIPYELINEWIETIKKHDYSKETSPRTIREAVEKTTKYSLQLNSFETHLKAAAFSLMSREKPVQDEASKSVCLLPVGADWTNREPLLGYLNALVPGTYAVPENGALQLIIDAVKNPSRPYFLILDEMNLSHVERYFADFLSAMESKESIFFHSGDTDYDGIPPSIALPDNLFIIGTVNIDETTYMFSPKVLDRANVIEFRIDETEMETFLDGNTTLNFNKLLGQGVNMAEDFLAKSRNKYQTSATDKKLTDDLLQFFIELKKVGAEFGYRTASEIIRFVGVTNQINSNWTMSQIFDAAIMQKLLPKLHGSRRKLESTLKCLAELCLYDKSLTPDILNPKKGIDYMNDANIKYPVSLEKIRRMNNGLINNNFTSYAEA
jgi:5-methylcytosine-specific restriction enzyme B